MKFPASNARRLALLAAAVAWFGVLLQLVLSLRRSAANGQSALAGLIVYFGFFTIITNLLVCWSLTAIAAAGTSRAGRFMAGPFAAGGIAVSITFVALSYHLLLRKVWDPQGADLLADVLLHYVAPVLYLAYWWFCIPRKPLRWVDPLFWSSYPVAYFAYALVRGEMIDSYPYGFIDVSAIGYGHAAINGIALLFGFVIVGELLVGLDRVKPGVIRP